MKHAKKILSSIAIIAIAIQSVSSAPLGVDQIEVLDENTLKVTLSENPNLEVGEQEAELTVLHDVELIGGFVSDLDANKVELLLENPILPNTNYSLLTLLGAEGSIDFSTPESVEGFATSNISSVSEQDIEGIEIIDSRTILISYTQEIEEEAVEFKFLAESNVTFIEKKDYDIPELIISIEPPLISDQDYILMFIEMQDVDGDYLEFDTGIYDFSTPKEDVEDSMSGSGELMTEETGSGELVSEEDSMSGSGELMTEETGSGELIEGNDTLSEDEAIDLNAADDDELSLEKDTSDIAMSAESTPDTGAETWVLILATLIINTFYYSARRKKSQLA